MHAVKPQTGEAVWKIEVSKRGLNTGVVVRGTDTLAGYRMYFAAGSREPNGGSVPQAGVETRLMPLLRRSEEGELSGLAVEVRAEDVVPVCGQARRVGHAREPYCIASQSLSPRSPAI